LKLLLREITDRYIQENFKRLQKEFANLTSVDSDTLVAAAEAAKRLEVTRIADEAIAKGKWVTATTGTNVALGQNNIEAKAVVLGIALNTVPLGGTVRVLLFGNYENSAFAYTLNDPLFLGTNGDMVAALPSSGWISIVARSNGNGSIFVKIEEPIGI